MIDSMAGGVADIDFSTVRRNLRHHVSVLCQEIGVRSVYTYANLARAGEYVAEAMVEAGCRVERQTFQINRLDFSNIVGTLPDYSSRGRHYILGAHYDTASGTVGADDNASAVAILIETARLSRNQGLGANWRFVGFTTEEPPLFHTRRQGSRVFARAAARAGERIDGVVVLEMLGYFIRTPGTQTIPFPLRVFGYPTTGDFVAVVGNWSSRQWTRRIVRAMRRNPGLPVQHIIVPERGFLFFAVRLSDHSSFWDHSYPAVMLTDTAFFRNPHYHTVADTVGTLDFDTMAEVVRSLLFCLADAVENP